MTKSDRMRLWTIQTKKAWARAEESGVLECPDVDADKKVIGSPAKTELI
ncbi:MAG: hypothetical protein ACXQS5_02080 [Candidatus Methanospirareceae archaeon]